MIKELTEKEQIKEFGFIVKYDQPTYMSKSQVNRLNKCGYPVSGTKVHVGEVHDWIYPKLNEENCQQEIEIYDSSYMRDHYDWNDGLTAKFTKGGSCEIVTCVVEMWFKVQNYKGEVNGRRKRAK